ncbi:MAG: hypothetical protein AAF282_00730 [Cyanobacteria bacterium P01_A01_bin.15]
MPFLPLFIVIGIFLAISKTLQPEQQYLQSVSEDYSEDYDEQALINQALIDYIARESRSKAYSNHGNKTSSGRRAEKYSNRERQQR